MKQPLVSIIIPTYNRAHLIGETLDSVLAQTYTNWECIVVDDGSTDNTDEVLKNYCEKDARFKYVHRPNTHKPGGNGARNYGFEVSKGKYINYLDSDDLLHMETLMIKLQLFDRYHCDIVISNHTKIFEELLDDQEIGSKVFSSSQFDIDFIKMRNSILIGDPMFKAHLMNKVKFNENLKRGQDHDFFLRLFRLNNKYCIIKTKLYYYKLTPKSITNLAGIGDKEMVSTQILIHKKMMKHYRENIDVIYEYERKTRKMYRSLIQKNRIIRILENYNFYRKCFHLNFTEFTLFFIYNILFQKGFDRMKYKLK